MIILRKKSYSARPSTSKFIFKEKSFGYKLSAPQYVREGGIFKTGKLTRSIVITPKENLQSLVQDIKELPGKIKNKVSSSGNIKTAIRRAKLKALNNAVSLPGKIENTKRYPGKKINDAIRFATDAEKGGLATTATWGGLTYLAPATPGITPASVWVGKNSKYIPGVETANYVIGNMGEAYQKHIGNKVGNITGYDLSRYAQMIPIG